MNKPASLLVVARHLTGRLHLYVADRLPSRTSPSYNYEVANPACQTTLGYPPVGVHLVGGGTTSLSRLVRNGLPSSPSLISIRLTARIRIAVHAVPPSRGRGGVNKQTKSFLKIEGRGALVGAKYQRERDR